MAAAALAGISPLEFIRTDDEVELALLNRVARKAIEIHGQYRQDLADRIILELGKAMERGKKRSGE